MGIQDSYMWKIKLSFLYLERRTSHKIMQRVSSLEQVIFVCKLFSLLLLLAIVKIINMLFLFMCMSIIHFTVWCQSIDKKAYCCTCFFNGPLRISNWYNETGTVGTTSQDTCPVIQSMLL